MRCRTSELPFPLQLPLKLFLCVIERRRQYIQFLDRSIFTALTFLHLTAKRLHRNRDLLGELGGEEQKNNQCQKRSADV